MLKRPENSVAIASNIEEDAKALANKKQRCTGHYVDVTDGKSMTPFIKKADLVISFVPATFHVGVAKICLQENKHMVTASYISPEMKEMDEQAKK